MSRNRRAIDKQRKHYASYQATVDWEEKKSRKTQSQINKKASLGISTKCPLPVWQNPNQETCNGCTLKCSYNHQ